MHEPSERHLPTSTTRAARERRLASVAALVVACLGFTLTLLLGARAGTSAPTAKAESSAAGVAPVVQGGNYSKFSHSTGEHARLPCLLCHRREDNSPRPIRSIGHTPCAGCHTQQFADASNPICTICHASPQSSAVKPFPSIRSFNLRFDHATHARAGARPRAACAACHKPARRGVALSIPAGFAAHTTCFQCHAPRAQGPSGRDISSCSTCHNLGGYRRTPESAPAYRVGFSHAEHARARLGCDDCHTLRAGASQGRQVTSPQPLMHHASLRARSCMTCHNNKRAFGGDDFSDCKRCHKGNAWHF
ncbi:MAG TPA: cytochrome c3 family protein [Pyrinomonadaceae bacterium]|nr:cytochrome c3 family protein [Pyrinomonadaceae bacterium]